MKRIYVFVWLLAGSFSVVAQGPKTEVLFGETIRLTMKNYFFSMDIVGRDETGVYGIQMPAKEVYGNTLGGIRNYHLARYNNKTLDNPELAELILKDEEGERNYEFSAHIGGQLYIFSSFQDRKQRHTYLYAETVDKENLGLKSDRRKIAAIDWSDESRSDRANFGFRFSPDRSKLMIRYTLINKENEVLRFGLRAMDNKFQLLWQSDAPVPVRQGSIFNFRRFFIDNKGDVYLLGLLFKSEKELEATNSMRKKSLLSSKRMVQREPNYVYQVVSYTNKGKTISDYVVEEPGKFITDLNIGVNNNQDIILTGFYAEEGTVSVKGAFTMRVRKGSKTLSSKVFHPFEKEFILKGLDEKGSKDVLEAMAAGEEYDKYQYNMEDIQFHDNGNYSMVAEQFVEESKTVRSGNYVSTEYRYYDDNIIIVTFKPSGDFAWEQKVPKHQFTHSANRTFASFAMLGSGNSMYFVFNEFPEGKPQRSKAVVAVVRPDGSLEREELFSYEQKKIVQPLTFQRTADREMCMFGLEGRNYSLARLNFN